VIAEIRLDSGAQLESFFLGRALLNDDCVLAQGVEELVLFAVNSSEQQVGVGQVVV
jgi:hypothetical protein